jgi:hypothetical protein
MDIWTLADHLRQQVNFIAIKVYEVILAKRWTYGKGIEGATQNCFFGGFRHMNPCSSKGVNINMM